MIVEISLIVASYLVGAIPFGLLLGRLVGADVRLEGSGNIAGSKNGHPDPAL